MQRLGTNKGGYRGETIDIQRVLREIEAARGPGLWLAGGAEAAHAELSLFKCSRRRAGLTYYWRKVSKSPRKRVYISAGIHGDEPAGPLATLELVRENRWPDDVAITLFPCLNPTGFPLNRRENDQGVDLNRDYRHLQTEEVKMHVAMLDELPSYDLSLLLHEDWESNGFYLYETNPRHEPSLAEKMIELVAKVCPIDTASEIDGWAAQHGIIRPNLKPEERPLWAEAIYLIQNKSRLGYTLEAPSDFPLPIRVAALTAAVHAALETI